MPLADTFIRPATRPPRVGLVLGAGGITGIAWLAGALEALRDHSGWDPASADIISGTSAGAIAATVLAAGQDPAGLLRYAECPEELEEAIRRATDGRERERPSLPWPGSFPLAAAGLVARNPRHRLVSLTGLLPRGLRSSDEIRGLTHGAASAGWPSERQLWLHACDYGTGRPVTFGRTGAPAAELSDAVVASCAIPGYYRPVRIGGRQYVDGGLRSFTNADRLVGESCEIVLILAPFSTRQRGALADTALFGPARAMTAARIEREAESLRADGAKVVVIDPAEADLRAMGLNLMDRSRSRHVVETAIDSVGERLDDALDGIDLTGRRLRTPRLRLLPSAA
jgi:NTE family protein